MNDITDSLDYIYNALTPIPYILLAMVDTGYLVDDYNMITAVSNCTG